MNNYLNQKFKIKHIKDPYDIWIIDDFLSTNAIDTIYQEWPSNDDPKWHRGHEYINGKANILESKMLGISKEELFPSYTKTIIKYFHSQDFCNYISSLLKIDGLICDSSMRWSGLRMILNGGHQLIHSDARQNPETKLRKELTCLLYLNKNYNRTTNEGCLEIWNDEMSLKIHEIEPIYNRMTIFLNSDTSFHGVPLVKADRKVITFSILKQGENSKRTKALFVKRPQDPEEIQSEGLKRSLISDKK